LQEEQYGNNYNDVFSSLGGTGGGSTAVMQVQVETKGGEKKTILVPYNSFLAPASSGLMYDASGKLVFNVSSYKVVDIEKAIAYLDAHAVPEYGIGKCATYVIEALVNKDGGGAKTSLAFPNPAKDFGPILEDMGFKPYTFDTYTPKRGDVVILQQWRTHSNGHMEMWDGNQWVSDYKQGNAFYPWTGSQGADDLPNFTVYRLQ